MSFHLPLTIVSHGLLLSALLAPSLSYGQDTPLSSGPARATEASDEVNQEETLLSASISIDFTERPEDNGGNLFLVGFAEVDEFKMPTQDARPADFKQLGVWIKTWPHTQSIELVESLHYMALYGYSEYPSPRDLTSKALHTSEMVEGVLSLTIEQAVRSSGESEPQERGQPPAKVKEVVEKLPDGLEETPTTVAIRIDPVPERLGGKLFLTGFSEVDEAKNLPARGAEPAHFQIIETDVQTPSMEASVRLQPGLGYLAIYGHGVHPETGDRMSLVSVYTDASTLELAIEDRIAGEPPEDGLAQPENIDPSTAGNAVPPPPTQTAPPAASSPPVAKAGTENSSKVWLIVPVTLLILLGFVWTQREPSSAPSSSRLERVGESEDDS